MTEYLIREKARTLRAKSRRMLIGTLVGPVAIAFYLWFAAAQFPALWMAKASLVFALVWSVAGVFFVNRGLWPRNGEGFSTGLQACRAELERQHDLARRVLVWSFGPIVLALGSLILSLAAVESRGLSKGLPFLVLSLAWIVSYLVIRMREQRNLQRELDELNTIEKG